MPIAPAHRMEFMVFINGRPVSGLLRASIVTTNCFSADTFALTFGIGAYPLGDIAFWSSISSAYLKIAVSSTVRPTYQSLITGMIDTVLVDPIYGTAGVDGRDLSSSMIDSYRQQDFVNQTASEVVSAIAQYHGLNPVVSSTTANVGRYYGD